MEFREILFRDITKISEAMVTLIQDQSCNYFITMTFNQPLSLTTTKKILKNFHAAIETILLGKHFYKRKSDRLFSISFIEHIQSNPHYHGYFRVEKRFERRFKRYAESAWKDVCQFGGIVVAERHDEQLKKTAAYVKKELFKVNNYENFVVSTDFHSN